MNESTPPPPVPETPAAPSVPEVDADAVARVHATLARQQNLPLAIVGGLAGALIGAAAWAGIAIGTNYEIGWLAIGVGLSRARRCACSARASASSTA